MVIDKGAEKRLKRGLHDLSPLFHLPAVSTTVAPSLLPPSFEVQFLTVCVPDHEGDAFLANAFLASQVVRQTNLFASLISIVPGFDIGPPKPSDSLPSLELLDSRISRLSLSLQELGSLTQNQEGGRDRYASSSEISESAPFLIFLEFEPAQFRSLARLALLLDRVILFVPPQAASLREAYRLMKLFWNLNREIEFFLLFRGRTAPEREKEFLFERFSLITSRFLGSSPGWLGDLAFPEKNDDPPVASAENSGFHGQPILAGEGLKRPLSPEKLRLWDELRRILRTHSP